MADITRVFLRRVRLWPERYDDGVSRRDYTVDMPESRKMVRVNDKDYQGNRHPLPGGRGAVVIDWRKRFKYIHLDGKDWISAEEVMQYIRDLEAAVPTEDNATDQSHPTIVGSSVN